MKKMLTLYVLTFMLVMSFILLPGVVSAKEQIKYVGSSTVGKFMYEAAKVYTKVKFNINTKPESGGGENAAAAGKTDLGGVAREVKPAILNKGVKKYLIGKDAIGAWINAENPVKWLTKTQLKDIFTGKITNWKELGGKNIPIRVYIVNPQSATRKVFSKAVMGTEKYGGRVTTIRPDTAIIEKVAADKGGIGQLSFALGDEHPLRGKVEKVIIDGQEPTVNNPNYPITRPLYLVTKGEPKGSVLAFIKWSRSEAGQKVLKRYFVGI